MRTDGGIEPADKPSRRPRPIHLHWRYIGLVGLGGAFGTAARYLLDVSVPIWAGLPLTTLGINIVGAFALGMLLEALLRRGHDDGFHRVLRLLAGTGFLGGFTTYSTFVVDTDTLVRNGMGWIALGYASATLILGALAAFCGILISARRHGGRHPGRSGDSDGVGAA